MKYTSKELGLDHYRVYNVVDQAVDYEVGLEGQFDKDFRRHRLEAIEHLANPADKNREGIFDPQAHMNWYRFDPKTAEEPMRKVLLVNQFGEQELLIKDARLLLVPTEKVEKGSSAPERLDHFKCYEVLEGRSVRRAVGLSDQFIRDDYVRVTEPLLFGVPVRKDYIHGIEELHNEKTHLAIYRITAQEHVTERTVIDQFDKRRLEIVSTAMLAVPSLKLKWKPVKG